MNPVAVVLLVAAFALAQALIGGTRLLYSIPACAILALPSLMAAYPRWKADRAARVGCLISTIVFCAYLLLRNRLSPIDYLARPDFFIVSGSLAVYLLVAVFLTRSQLRVGIFCALVALGLAHTAMGAIQFRRGDQYMLLPWIRRMDDGWRASGFYISPNHYAGFLEVVVLMTISLVCWGKFGLGKKIMLSYAAVCCLVGLGLSGSRGGYLSFAFGLCVLITLSLVILRKIAPEKFLSTFLGTIGALAAFVSTGVFLILQSVSIQGRIRAINDPENMRFLLWKAAMVQFRLQPVWGTGSGSYLYYGRMFRNPLVQNDPIYVHNDYLHLLAEYGLVGAALFLTFFSIHVFGGLKNLAALSRNSRPMESLANDRLALQVGALSTIAAYTFHSAVDFNLHIPANAFVMASMFGMVAAPSGRQSNNFSMDGMVLMGSRILLVLLGVALLAFGLPKFPGEWFAEKARVALRDYDLWDARTDALKALQYEKKNPDIYYYAGEAMREMALQKIAPREEGNRAVEMFQTGLSQFPQDVRIVLKLAQTYDELRQFNLAEAQLDHALELDPNGSLVYAYYGLHYQKQGSLLEAEMQYALALELDGKNKIARAGYDAVEKMLQPERAEHPKKPAPIVDDADFELKSASDTPVHSPRK